jgi:hypothetical protein
MGACILFDKYEIVSSHIVNATSEGAGHFFCTLDMLIKNAVFRNSAIHMVSVRTTVTLRLSGEAYEASSTEFTLLWPRHHHVAYRQGLSPGCRLWLSRLSPPGFGPLNGQDDEWNQVHRMSTHCPKPTTILQ